MADVFVSVRQGLRTQLETIVPTDHVAWQGRTFQPPTDGTPWYRETLLPASTQLATLGPRGRIRTTGLYQIDCFTPILKRPGGDGMGTLDGLVSTVMGVFPPNQQWVVNGITMTVRATERRDTPPDAAWLRAAVRVSWYADTTNTI